MSEELMQKYRNIALKFISNNKSNLIRIYLEHSQKDGNGILMINMFEIDKTQNVDVSYVKNEIVDNDLLEKINDRKSHNNNDDIIYLLLITPVEEKIIEIDVSTLSQ